MRDLGATRRLAAAAFAALAWAPLAAGAATADTGAGPARRLPQVLPSLRPNLVAYYDFDHPVRGDPARERDRGFSGTAISLTNGGAAMRVRDGASPGGGHALQTRQVNPAVRGNDDWKAGTYAATGVPSLRAFNGVKEASIMGWFKVTGPNPGPDSETPDPSDHYNAVGLAGLLSGDSQGHDVRALLEVIDVAGTLRVVALGRRLDGGKSQTFAANEDWQSILPTGRWVFLAASFDYDHGTMRLYRNGRPLDGFYTTPGDPWQIETPGTHLTSPTDPRGIKIGGSFPQNTAEKNPCDCRLDGLMFLDRAVTDQEVRRQYHRTASGRH
jgi:concanavalin A-like lectin/glucanase superfamily protein